MHDQTSDSSSSKSKSNSTSTSSRHRTSSSSQKKRLDQSSYKSSTDDSYRKRVSLTNPQDKSSTIDTNTSSKKRSASTSIENKQKKSTANVNNKPNKDEKNARSHETDSFNKIANESYCEKRRNSSSSSYSQPSKHQTSRTDITKTSDKLGIINSLNFQFSIAEYYKNDKLPID
ncbi:unnamed protein product [Rotaria magnacalcarata]|uniref:Uncharacterized protein n=1 Tax=Rotaria magnacalcarata TaxID=392030 RepID=A0A8S3IWJ6_9BILA|nr:unnamed protein product [Rotaria magnacalcarata]CAF5209971.1 unnamed protein product [Rotaria magnacalcarata]